MHVTMHRTADPGYVTKVVEILKRATADLEALVSAK
jgi:hypothetical protein